MNTTRWLGIPPPVGCRSSLFSSEFNVHRRLPLVPQCQFYWKCYRELMHHRERKSFQVILQQINGGNNTDCNGLLPENAGCGIVEWSRSSYGPYFDSQGGGVFAMKWDENGISVCTLSSLFHTYSCFKNGPVGLKGHFIVRPFRKILSLANPTLQTGEFRLRPCHPRTATL